MDWTISDRRPLICWCGGLRPPQRRAAAPRKWVLQPGMNALVSGATATRERQIEDAKLTEGFGSTAASARCLVHCTPTVSQRLSSVSAGEDIAINGQFKVENRQCIAIFAPCD